MKKSLGWMVGLAVFAAVLAGAAQAQKAPGKPGTGHELTCPMRIEGASVQVTDDAQGVTIRITSQDPAVVKKIQAAAAGMAKHHASTGKAGAAKPEVWVCPMGCYRGPKTPDGRCPKCGMDIKKQ